MNRKLISAAALALTATPMAYAQSNVTIYGVVDAAVTLADNGLHTLKRVDSGAGWGSRLGFRGSEDLGGGLRANFLLEQGLDISSGTLQQGGAAFGRSAWLGLSGADWELRAGRQVSPVALSLLAVDPFVGNYWGNLQQTGIGTLQSPTSTAGDPGHQASARINNSVLGRWTSGGLILRAMVAPGESTAANGSGNFASTGFVYQSGPWLATAAVARFRQYSKDITGTGTPQWQPEWTIAGSYDFGPVKLALGHYRFDPSERNKTLTATTTLRTQSTWLGGTVPLGMGQLLLQVVRNDTQRIQGVAEGRSTTVAATYEYNLSKRTVLYVSGGQVNNNATSNTMFVASTVVIVPSGMGADLRALSIGARHSF